MKHPNLQPTIDAAYAKLTAECDAIRASVPKIRGDWGLMETDTLAITEATRPLREAYYEWLHSDPVAQAELAAAAAAWEASLPDEPEPADEDETDDEDEED